jgi:diacylglycerol O-acyltransferase / wax synthase
MERLSPADAAILLAETATQPMHVLGVLIVDPHEVESQKRYPIFRERITERFAAIPPCRQKIAMLPGGQPVWVDAADIYVDQHLRHAVLPVPGTYAQLGAVVAEIAARRLSRDDALWEAWMIEGLEDGRVVVIAKVHHCAIDGVSGFNSLAEFFDLDAHTPLPVTSDWDPQAPPNRTATGAAALNASVDWLTGFVRSASHLGYDFIGRQVKRPAPRAPTPFLTPKLPMNGSLSSRRTIALRTLPLEPMKQIRSKLNVTVNDVVTALCAGALRRHLVDTGQSVRRPLVACIPVSERTLEDSRVGNKFSMMFYELPVHVDDAIARVYSVQSSAETAKRAHERVPTGQLDHYARLFPPLVLRWGMEAISRFHLANVMPPFSNVIISNVRGPDFPLFVAGGRVESMFPLGPLIEGVTLNITVASYLEHVGFGLLGCAEHFPELETLADKIEEELAELREVTGIGDKFTSTLT